MLVSVLSLGLAGCTQIEPYLHLVLANEQLGKWYSGALRHPKAHPAFQQFSDAYHGDSNALRAYFADALTQSESEKINAAGGEELMWTLEILLSRLGDQRFADALAKETSRAQSAVGGFIHTQFLRSYPKTQKILHDSPKIIFPLSKAYGNS